MNEIYELGSGVVREMQDRLPVSGKRCVRKAVVVRRLLEMNFPVVFIDVPVSSLEACVITTDNRLASAGLTEQCLNEGVEDGRC
jgi:hypothetical protein